MLVGFYLLRLNVQRDSEGWTRSVTKPAKHANFWQKMADPMRIGILGGSFDPPHIGHLWIAEAVREALETRRNPLDTCCHFSAEARWPGCFESAKTADGGPRSLRMFESYLVDDRELNRGDVSYTVDTLQDLKTEFPQRRILS